MKSFNGVDMIEKSGYKIKYPMGTGELLNSVADNIKSVANSIRDISKKEEHKKTKNDIGN